MSADTVPWYKRPVVWLGILTILTTGIDEICTAGLVPETWAKVLSVAGGLLLIFNRQLRSFFTLIGSVTPSSETSPPTSPQTPAPPVEKSP